MSRPCYFCGDDLEQGVCRCGYWSSFIPNWTTKGLQHLAQAIRGLGRRIERLGGWLWWRIHGLRSEKASRQESIRFRARRRVK